MTTKPLTQIRETLEDRREEEFNAGETGVARGLNVAIELLNSLPNTDVQGVSEGREELEAEVSILRRVEEGAAGTEQERIQRFVFDLINRLDLLIDSLPTSQETATYTTEQARMRLRETLLTEEYPQDGTAEEYFIRAAFPDDPQEVSDEH
jgi:hypothetical protein